MKKIIRLLSVMSIVAFFFVSCDNALDINKDPNYPSSASSGLLFSSGTTWSASILGSDVQLTTALWAQHYSQNNTSQQYFTIDSYNLAYNSTYFTRYWSSIYAGALPDLKRVISQSAANGEWNYWLQSKILTAFDFYMLSSLWETIPLSQALQGNDNLTPAYDDPTKIDGEIIQILDDAIAKKADAAAIITNMGGSDAKDMIFKGNIDNWVKFAKTLKLKILMRNFTANTTAITALLTEGDLLKTDAKFAQFTDAENKSNPLYENDRRKLNTTSNIRVSATLVQFLKTYNDPRIAAFAEPVTQYIQVGSSASTDKLVNVPASMQPYYRGLDQGVYGNPTFSSNVLPPTAHSRAVLAANDPVYFLSAAESNFLQAEAWARLNNPTNAKTAYDAAVKAAFSRWGYDATPFISAGGAYEFKTTSLDAMLNCILMQKWVSSVRTDSWNAFFDICRTGIPAMGTQTVTDLTRISMVNANYVVGTLAPSLGSVLGAGQYPHRFLIPKSSLDYNPKAPAVIPITTKMWWHK